MKSSRQLAFDILVKVFAQKAYSNLAFDQAVRKENLPKSQAAFASALVYGVLERSIGIDYAIQKYLKKGNTLNKLDTEVLVILRMGFYQLCYLNSVPDTAAVDESVKLASYARKTSAKGLINAVLRSFLRDGKNLYLPDQKKDENLFFSVKYSCPQWLFLKWSAEYGKETAIHLAEESLKVPPLTIRVNSLKLSDDALMIKLRKAGIEVRKHAFMEHCLILESSGSLQALAQFQDGSFHVQDLSSQMAVEALAPEPGMLLLDICAAPGSKSFTAAERMENSGRIFSFDLYEHKLNLIREGAKRLSIDIITAQLRDAQNATEDLPMADCILCDVPCSGLGVIRRKPEIKLKSPADFDSLPKIQLAILKNAASHLKKGGKLLYSTCTLNPAENENLVAQFLLEDDSMKPLQLPPLFRKIGCGEKCEATLFPHITGSDGFFLSLMQKTGE